MYRVLVGKPKPTDTFQMAIDDMWKQGKISETVYKYVPSMLFITHRLQAYFLNIRQMPSVYINALLQACLEVAVHAPPLVLINSRNFVNSGLFGFLNSRDTPPEHTVFQEAP